MIYLDSSAATAILLNEQASGGLRFLLDDQELYASPLLEAEVLSVLNREKFDSEVFDPYVARITWIMPARSLKNEMLEILAERCLRGADLWHLASALYAFKGFRNAKFCSLDANQRSAAAACGLQLLPKKI